MIQPFNTTPLRVETLLSGQVQDLGSGLNSVQYQIDNLPLVPVVLTPAATPGSATFNQTIDLRTISEGQHQVRFVADDKAGNLFYQTFTITIDNPPVLAAKLLRDTAPLGRTNTDGYTSDPTIVGSATDRNGVVVLRARFANQPTLVNITPQVKPADGSFTLNRTQLETIYGGVLPEGQHTLLLQTQDGTGNLAEKTVTFTLDTVAPLLTLTSVANQAALSSGVRLVGGVVEVRSAAMLSYRFDRLAAVELKTTNGGFNQAISFAGVSNGSHTLTLTGVDQAGNASTIVLNVTVNIPTPIAPSITVNLSRDTAIDGGTNTDRWTADPTITAQIDRTQITTVQVGLDNMPEAAFVDVTNRLTAEGGLTLTRAQIETLIGQPLTEGTHTIYVQGKDRQGLQVTQDMTFVLDTTLPVLTFDQPYYSTQATNPTISGETEPGAVIRLYKGTLLLGTVTADAAGFWELATGVLTEGANALTAKAIDRAGNVGAITPITVTIDHQPPAVPTELKLAEGYDTGKSRSDAVTRVSNPIVTGKAEPRSWVQVFRSGVLVGETITADDGTWQVEVATLPEGISDLSAIATDEAGNVGAISGLLRLTIDLTPPTAPTGLALVATSDTGISATDRLTKAINPTIAGRAEPNLLVQLFDGSRFLGQAIADALGNWQITSPQLADGVHNLVARAFDPVANRSALSTPLQVTVDATGPDLSLTSLYANASWAVGDPLVGTVTNAGVPIAALSYQIFAATNLGLPLVSQSVSVNAQGGFNAPLSLGSLVTGTPYVFVATATDAAGNTTTKSLNFQRATTVTLPAIPSGSASILSYGSRLDTMLTEAGLALTGNRQVGLNQAKNTLNQIGTLVAAGGFQAGMAGVLQGLYALANQPMTQAQAQAAGRALATTLMTSDLPIATQVMQAKLLAAAFSVPALRGALPTGAGDTPLSLALKDLAVTYLATRSDPTQPLTNRSDMPNLLSLIGSVTTQSELSQAALRLGAALKGTEAPDKAVRMVERLLRMSQQTVMVQGSLGDEQVSGGLVDLGFAYGRLNPATVTDPALLATLPFQQVWQATDAAGLAAARPGFEAFFGAFEGAMAQRTLVQNQAYLLERVKLDGLLSPQELRDPSQIHNVMATGTYLFTPNPPSDESGGGSGGLAPGATPMLAPVLAPTAAPTAVPSSGAGAGFVPASPGLGFAPGIPASIAQVPMNILGDRFYNPDGSPKFYPEPLDWEVQVPEFFSLLHLFVPGSKIHAPNWIDAFGVTSYGGVQVIRGEKRGYGEFIIYTYFNERGERITAEKYVVRGLFLFWEPEYGLGTVVYKGRRPRTGEAQLSAGLESAGSLAPNVGDPEWVGSPPPQPADPGSRPMPPGTETKPLPNGGTAPVKPSPVRPNNPQKPGDGPNFPPEGEPLPPRKPIEDMSPLEALWDSWMRAIDQLPPELRAWARIQLGNLALQGAAAGLLLLFLLGGAIATRAAASALSLLGAGSAALLVLGLAKVAEAIWSKSSAALDEAVNFFARWAREAQSSMSPGALAQKIGELTGSLESIPVFGKYVKLLDTVKASAISDAIFRGQLAELNAVADKLAPLDPATRGALQKAISSSLGNDVITDLNSLLTTFQPTEVQQLVRIPNVSVTQLNNLSRRSTDGLDLLRAELNGAHSIERHGSQLSNSEMEQRVLGTNPTLPQSRSALKFVNDTVHRDAVNQAYRNFEAEIKSHFLTGGGYREWTYDYGAPTGTGFTNTGTRRNPITQPINIGDTTKVTITFDVDPTSSTGFRLVSAFPTYP